MYRRYSVNVFSRYIIELASGGTGHRKKIPTAQCTYKHADMRPSHVARFKTYPIKQVCKRGL